MGQSRAKWGRSVAPEDSGLNTDCNHSQSAPPELRQLVPVPPRTGCMSCHRGYASLILHFPQLLLGP